MVSFVTQGYQSKKRTTLVSYFHFKPLVVGSEWGILSHAD
jgi:hypothetical protein